MALFTVKYAPQDSSEVIGQDTAVSSLKDFVINYKRKKQRAALLHGPVGNGKTSSVYALAKELTYDLLEINSSDLRNEEAMKSFLGSAIGQQSLFMTPKMILIDEIDNISGRNDRGCIPALLKIMEMSTFPLILTANDITDAKLKGLVKKSQLIEFPKIDHKHIAAALEAICRNEGITHEQKALNSLARQCDGDVRSALIDLQVCSVNGTLTFEDITQLSDRKRTIPIMNALRLIFKSSTTENALSALEYVDVELKDVMFWIDANLPKEYLNPSSLAKAYEWLSRADVFQGRISRQQHWRFLAYINDLITAGISSAKDRKNPAFVPYHQTMRFLQMWQAKMKWVKKREIAAKLAELTHTSSKVAYGQVAYLQQIFHHAPSEELTQELDLSEDEVEWLRG